MSIPKFNDIAEVEWRHNDFMMRAEVTASYIVRTRACIADEDSTPEKCQRLEDKAVHDLRSIVHESVMEECHVATLGAGTCQLKPWEMERDTGFYDCMECACGYVADVADWAEWHFCPNCGRKVVDK